MFVRIVSGILGGRKVAVPSVGVRPTSEKVRAALFNTLESAIDTETTTFIDCFAGSGAIAFEAFSRGYRMVYAIEKQTKTYAVLRSNKDMLIGDTELFMLLRGDARKILKTIKAPAGPVVLFLDPPYRLAEELSDDVIREAKKNGVITPKSLIVVETDSSWKTTLPISQLKVKKYGDTVLTWFSGD